MPRIMKLKLISLAALSALALGGVCLAQDQDNGEGRRRGGRGGMRRQPLEQMTEGLNLTAEQKARVQPIVDEAKPKMEAIHREAMEKSKAVMDGAMAKIRPLLTPEQQKQLDGMKNNPRGKGRRGHRGRNRDAGGGRFDDQG